MIPESSPKCIKPPRSFLSPERIKKKQTRISDKAIAHIWLCFLYIHVCSDFSFRSYTCLFREALESVRVAYMGASLFLTSCGTPGETRTLGFTPKRCNILNSVILLKLKPWQTFLYELKYEKSSSALIPKGFLT